MSITPNPPITLGRNTRIAVTPALLVVFSSIIVSAVLAGGAWAWGIGRDVEDVKATLESMDRNLSEIAKSRVSEVELRHFLDLLYAKNPSLVRVEFSAE